MTDLEQEMMDDLFRSWSMAYRGAFTGQFRSATDEQTETLVQEWKTEFATYLAYYEVTVGQVRWAMEASRERFERTAPTYGEFLGLCRAYRPIKAPALPAPHKAPSPEASKRLSEAAGKLKASDNKEWRRTFFNRPGSQIACDMVLREAKTSQRFADHLAAAIVGGYMDEKGTWSGKR